MDKFAVLRSLLSHEEVHFRGQYYVQTGRQMNLAFAREIPSIGCVIAMELESRRRPRHVPDLHVLQPGQGCSWSALNGIPAAAILGGGHQSRSCSKRHGARSESDRTAGRALAAARRLREAARPRSLAMGEKWPATKISMTQRINCSPTSAGPMRSKSPKRTASATATIPWVFLHSRAQCPRAGCRHALHPHLPSRLGPPCADLGSKASSNHYTLCAEFDPAFSSLLEDLGPLRSKTDP